MDKFIKFLPTYLINRYKKWKSTDYKKKRSWYKKIALTGQNPSTMVISCCDSRVHVTSMFGVDKGEFFIHRNIANLIPPYNPDGDYHGTSAAVEYAVKNLKITNIIVLGHSNCGGIKEGYFLFKNIKKKQTNIFVNKWLTILKPAFKNVTLKNKNKSDKLKISYLEKESIKISITNLNDFPFIKKLIKKNKLSIHGLWHDISSGNVESLNPHSLQFEKI